MGKDGHLAMSPAVWWQDMCATTLTNIVTMGNVELDDVVNG